MSRGSELVPVGRLRDHLIRIAGGERDHIAVQIQHEVSQRPHPKKRGTPCRRPPQCPVIAQ